LFVFITWQEFIFFGHAVFLGGVFSKRERGGVGFETFQLHPLHGFLSAETLLRVEDFQPGQPAFAVVISGDALGQMFAGDRGFAKRDAQRIHFGIVADFHRCGYVSRHREDIHRHGFDRVACTMNHPADVFCRFTRESCFPAMLTHQRGNFFHQHAPAFDVEDLADQFRFCGIVAADMAIKHGYLRFRFSIHSFGSGS
jgi:hypothetical protein